MTSAHLVSRSLVCVSFGVLEPPNLSRRTVSLLVLSRNPEYDGWFVGLVNVRVLQTGSLHSTARAVAQVKISLSRNLGNGKNNHENGQQINFGNDVEEQTIVENRMVYSRIKGIIVINFLVILLLYLIYLTIISLFLTSVNKYKCKATRAVS